MSARERAHAMFPIRLRAALLLAASLGLLLGGCSASPRSAEAPAMARTAPEGAAEDPGTRAEIARLWDEIDAWRGQAGTTEIAAGYAQPPGPEPAGAGEAMSGGDSGGEAVTAGNDPGRVSASLRSPDAACPATASEPPECRDSCTLATSICDNAGRICRLAQQLAGDDWAAGKCTDAGAVCRQATADCCGCRAGG
jgi:hypothetical protein